MKKIGFGLLAGLLMLGMGVFIGEVFLFFFPSIKSEYENPSLFRPWSDPIMSIYYVVPFLEGVILAWIWVYTKKLFTAKNMLLNGLFFGLIYGFFSIPGMLMSYSSFPLSGVIVISWSVTTLFQGICAGILFSTTLN